MTTDTFSHVDPVDPVSLIAELEDAGVELWEDNGRIRFRGPKGALTEAHRAVLRAAREQRCARRPPRGRCTRTRMAATSPSR